MMKESSYERIEFWTSGLSVEVLFRRLGFLANPRHRPCVPHSLRFFENRVVFNRSKPPFSFSLTMPSAEFIFKEGIPRCIALYC